MEQAMIGKFISACRKEKGLTQSNLGEAVGYDQSRVAKWESGKLEPNAETLKKLAVFFGVTSDYLIGLEDD